MISFKNQINEKIPRSGVIDQETINPHDLCYQCSKYGPDLLFGKSRIRNSIDKPHFTAKIKLSSSQIKLNTSFRSINERKKRTCDKNRHKSVQITVFIKKTKVLCYS